MAGAIGGMLMSQYNGYILTVFGSHQPIFALAGGMHLHRRNHDSLLGPLTRVTEEAVREGE